jgi:hypothetical protein
VDRDVIARTRRRAEALEALEEERSREVALVEQLELVVLDGERRRIDEAALELLAPADAELVREALALDEWWRDDEVEEEDFADPDGVIRFDDDQFPEDDPDAEVARLSAAIETSRRTQGALERFVAALDAPTPPPIA